MPDLVEREQLNAACFPRKGLSAQRYARLCREGKLPGAVKVGDRWMVDLERFQAAVDGAGAAPAPAPAGQSFQERVRALRAQYAEAQGRG